jgi:transposase InsO family protein
VTVQQLVKCIKLQKGYQVQVIRSDNGGEFVSHQWKAWMLESGMEQQHNDPYASHQAGRIERINRTIHDMPRYLMKDSGLESQYIMYALQYSAYILNRTTCSHLAGISPYESMHQVASNVDGLFSFGATVHYRPNKVLIPFDPHAEQGIFLGYAAIRTVVSHSKSC